VSNIRRETWIWLAQRTSGAVLAICVLVHLATIVYAVRGGLGAAEILTRTRGSVGVTLFYGLFVLAVAIHAPIGVRAILIENTNWRGRTADIAILLFGAMLIVLGLRAVWAVTR
jgi:fumarate reductase subunit C